MIEGECASRSGFLVRLSAWLLAPFRSGGPGRCAVLDTSKAVLPGCAVRGLAEESWAGHGAFCFWSHRSRCGFRPVNCCFARRFALFRRVTFFLREKSNQKTRLKDTGGVSGASWCQGLQNADYGFASARLRAPGLRHGPKVARVEIKRLPEDTITRAGARDG